MQFSRPDGTPIKRWEDWTRPKRPEHWKAGRSAMELAKAWFRDGALAVPEEFKAVLASHSRFSDLTIEQGVPELVTPLPQRGEGRNHDLALVGKTPSERVTICVEAKADEPFGAQTVKEYLGSALRRRADGERTNVPERIVSLLAMLGRDVDRLEYPPWQGVPYQLLTAICGTLIQARRDDASCAVLTVHEFRTRYTSDETQAGNHRELLAFFRAVIGDRRHAMDESTLLEVGPLGGISCFLGTVRTTTVIRRHLDHLVRRWLVAPIDYSDLSPEDRLSREQSSIIERYERWMQALDKGDLPPVTDAQRRFVAVCRGQREAQTEFEKAHLKYRKLRQAGREQVPVISTEREEDIDWYEGWGTTAWEELVSDDDGDHGPDRLGDYFYEEGYGNLTSYDGYLDGTD